MADPFVAEIRIFPFNFAPRGWAFCQGQILSISQNTALFSLLGTTYGGNGQTTFGLPNLQGRSAVHQGQGPGLSPIDLGQTGGAATVTLAVSQIPPHTHEMTVQSGAGTRVSPIGNYHARNVLPTNQWAAASDGTKLNSGAIATAGSSQPHDNQQPYLALSFCIALQGVFPPLG